MERKMRRFRQLLDAEDAKGILETTSNGVLSLKDTDGEPYGVPLSLLSMATARYTSTAL